MCTNLKICLTDLSTFFKLKDFTILQFLKRLLRVLGIHPKKKDFVYFDVYYSHIFLLFKMGSYVSPIITTFYFTSAYVEAVLRSIGKVTLYRKNGNF